MSHGDETQHQLDGAFDEGETRAPKEAEGLDAENDRYADLLARRQLALIQEAETIVQRAVYLGMREGDRVVRAALRAVPENEKAELPDQNMLPTTVGERNVGSSDCRESEAPSPSGIVGRAVPDSQNEPREFICSRCHLRQDPPTDAAHDF